MKILAQNSKIILLISLFFLVFFLFLPAFNSYFFQDDWFSFRISTIQNFSEVFSFFKPLPDLIYYRPLGMQIPFFLVQTFFGINPLPFRVATLLIHLLNGYLVFQILNSFFKSRQFSAFGAALYLTSATHMIVFYWAATFAFVLGPCFYFSSFLAFIRKKIWLSLVLFIIGFFVNELIMTLPGILVLYIVSTQKWTWIKSTLSFWLVTLAYVVFRLTIAQFATTGGYVFLTQVDQIFKNLRNYFLWALNWPDEIYAQFVSFFLLNPLFIKNFLFTVVLLGLLTSCMILVFFLCPTLMLLKRKTRKEDFYPALFGVLWFVITLSPVLYFAKHFFSYYVPIPLLGLIIAGLSLFEKAFATYKIEKYKIGIFIAVFLLWYASAWHTTRLNQHIHWSPQRAVQSKILTSQIKKQFPTLPSHSVVIIPDGAKNEELKWALGEQNGLKVLYGDPSIETYYGTVLSFKAMHPDQSPATIYVLE